MKAKFFMMAIALAVVVVSCSKPNEGPAEDPNVKKSVSVVIENMVAPSPDNSRGTVITEFTTDGGLIANASDLIAYFTDEDGDIIAQTALSGAVTSTPATIKAGTVEVSVSNNVYTYTFHQISSTVEGIFITNQSVDAATEAAVIAKIGNMSGRQTNTLNAFPVWGKSAVAKNAYKEHVEGGVTYKYYSAGAITIAPLVARLEIANINCSDLDGAVNQETGLAPYFGSLTLGRIGIQNTKNITSETNVINYTTEALWDAAADGALWNTNSFDATANANVLDVAKTFYKSKTYPATAETEEKTVGAGFAYNILPGSVPKIILEISNGVKNTNVTTTGTLTYPRYVRSTGISGVDAIEAGKIYQVGFTFPSSEVKPWAENPTLICVDVKVTVPKWNVSGPLTPTFN